MATQKKNDPMAEALAAAQAEAVEAGSIGRRGRPKGSGEEVLAAIEDRIVEAAAILAGKSGKGKASPILGVVEAALVEAGREDRTQPTSLIARKTFRDKVKAAGLAIGHRTEKDGDGYPVRVPFIRFRDGDTVEN